MDCAPCGSGTYPPSRKICSVTATATLPSLPDPGTGLIAVQLLYFRLRAKASLLTEFQLFCAPIPMNEYTSNWPSSRTLATALLETGMGRGLRFSAAIEAADIKRLESRRRIFPMGAIQNTTSPRSTPALIQRGCRKTLSPLLGSRDYIPKVWRNP